MKLQIEKNQLLNPLSQVIRSLGSKTLEILNMVKIVATDNQIVLTASDMETEITAVIENPDNTPGEICVSGKMFHNVVKNAPDGTLTIEIKKEFLVVKQRRILQKLVTMPTQDYPEFGDVSANYILVMQSSVLQDMIQKVTPFMGKADVRHYLNGICMKLDTDMMTIAATDGHRLSVIDHKIDYKQEAHIEALIAGKSVAYIAHILEQDKSIELHFSVSQLKAIIGNLTLKTKLIDARYPDFRRVIPDYNATTGTIKVSLNEISHAIDRALAISAVDKFTGVTLTVKDGLLNLRTHTINNDESDEQIEVELTGDEFTVGLNAPYLKDALSVINTSDVLIKCSGENNGFIICPDDERFVTVIMPVRV